MSVDVLNKPIQSFIEVSYGIFATLPREVEDTEVTDAFRMCVLQASRMFRSALKSLNEEISSIAEATSDDNGAGDFDAEFDMIYSIEQIWHICEIVLLNPSNQVYFETAKWLKV